MKTEVSVNTYPTFITDEMVPLMGRVLLNRKREKYRSRITFTLPLSVGLTPSQLRYCILGVFPNSLGKRLSLYFRNSQ